MAHILIRGLLEHGGVENTDETSKEKICEPKVMWSVKSCLSVLLVLNRVSLIVSPSSAVSLPHSSYCMNSVFLPFLKRAIESEACIVESAIFLKNILGFQCGLIFLSDTSSLLEIITKLFETGFRLVPLINSILHRCTILHYTIFSCV